MLRLEMYLGMSFLEPANWTCAPHLWAIFDSCLTTKFTLDGRTRYPVELTSITSLGFISTS